MKSNNRIGTVLAVATLALGIVASAAQPASAQPCRAIPNRICSVCSTIACYP